MKQPLLHTSLKQTTTHFLQRTTLCIFLVFIVLFIASKIRVWSSEEMVGAKTMFLQSKEEQHPEKLKSEIKGFTPQWVKNIKDPAQRKRSQFFAMLVLDEVKHMNNKYDFEGALFFGMEGDQRGFFRFLRVGEEHPMNSFVETIRGLQKRLNIYDTIIKIEEKILNKIGQPDAKTWWQRGPSEMLYYLRCYNILNEYTRHHSKDLHMFFITPAAEILSDPNYGDESLDVKRTLQTAEAVLGNREDVQKNKLALKELEKIQVPKDAIIWISSDTASDDDEAYSMKRNQMMPDTEQIKPPDDLVDKIVAAMLEIPITDLVPTKQKLEELMAN